MRTRSTISRVATRRLKAAIDLLEPVLDDDQRKPFAKAGKKLRRRLGPLRDLDVMVGYLKAIQRIAKHRPAATWLAERLMEAKEQARKESKKQQSPGRVLGQLGVWWGLREEVLESREAVAALLSNSLHLQLDYFAEQAQRLAPGTTHSHRLDPHEIRIAGKALRYTLEMARAEGHALSKDVSKQFKKMQESFGIVARLRRADRTGNERIARGFAGSSQLGIAAAGFGIGTLHIAAGSNGAGRIFDAVGREGAGGCRR